ncbi:MAG: F0F1 ATP synthase subunit B [Legionellales bacterium]
MNINLTLLGQAITFGIFIWFTMKFVWPPIMQAISERQQKIADGLAAAQQGQDSLQQAEKVAHDELSVARKKAAEIVDGAHKRAEQMISHAQEKAQAEGQRLLEQAHAQISQDMQQAREKLQREIAQIAIAGAQQLLERSVDEKAQQELIDKFAQGI